MAELDYAFLAEYAKVDERKLTAIGASYTHMRFKQLPATHFLSIAGRIRAKINERPSLAIRAISPNNAFEIKFEVPIEELSEASAYNDFVGILFAVNGPIPIFETGLYEVKIELDGEVVRTLKFEAEVRPDS